MKQKHKKSLIQLVTEFAKLQLASNIPFWGTYIGFAILDTVFHVPSFYALIIPTVLSNLLFFIVDDKWVFASDRGNKKSSGELMKFIVFITFSATAVFYITMLLEQQFNITPYVGQFIAGFCATFWTFFILRFWVFAPAHHGPFSPARAKLKIKARHRTIKPKTA